LVKFDSKVIAAFIFILMSCIVLLVTVNVSLMLLESMIVFLLCCLICSVKKFDFFNPLIVAVGFLFAYCFFNILFIEVGAVSQDLINVLLLVVLFLTITNLTNFLFNYKSTFGKKWLLHWLQKLEQDRQLVHADRIYIVMLISCLLSIGAILFMLFSIYHRIAIGDIFNSLNTRYIISNGGNEGWFLFLQLILFVFILSVTINLFIYRRKIVLTYLLCFMVFMLLMFLGLRGLIFQLVLFLLVIRHIQYKHVGAFLCFAIAIGFMLFIVFYGVFRTNGQVDSIKSFFDLLLGRADAVGRFVEIYSRIKTCGNACSYPNPILGFLEIFIPRSFYPEKPYQISTLFTQWFYPEVHQRHVNLAFSALAEAYLYMNVFGVILLGIIYGYIISLFNYIYNYAYKEKSLIIAIWVSLFLLYPVNVFEMGFFNSMANVLVVFYMIIFCFFMKLFFRNSNSTKSHHE
jgi:oligosaccharide repeat unit polymerase